MTPSSRIIFVVNQFQSMPKVFVFHCLSLCIGRAVWQAPDLHLHQAYNHRVQLKATHEKRDRAEWGQGHLLLHAFHPDPICEFNKKQLQAKCPLIILLNLQHVNLQTELKVLRPRLTRQPRMSFELLLNLLMFSLAPKFF